MLKKIFKRVDNKAFTIIEILLAVALLAIAAVAIGAVIISTQNNTAQMFSDTELQQQLVEVQENLHNEILGTNAGIKCWAKQPDNGQWVLSKHKKRSTYETQGGRIEQGETLLECAKRELYEESGIKDATIYPVCDYVGYNHISSSNGQVFLAIVHSLDKLLDSEMSKIKLFEKLPENLTYPNVSPRLYEESYKLYLLLKK